MRIILLFRGKKMRNGGREVRSQVQARLKRRQNGDHPPGTF